MHGNVAVSASAAEGVDYPWRRGVGANAAGAADCSVAVDGESKNQHGDIAVSASAAEDAEFDLYG